MEEWIEPAVNGVEGWNSFLGLVMPVLLWVCLALFIAFLIMGLAKRLFNVSLI